VRKIEMQKWPRREHYMIFSALDHPHFGMTANVAVTKFVPHLKKTKIPFTVALTYLLARVANEIREFRYRIRDGDVYEHECVHPSITILAGAEMFAFCTFEYLENLRDYSTSAAKRIAQVKEHPTLNDEQRRDDLLFMTSIPWVSFTSFMHPMNLQPADSIPRIAWGKYFQEGESLKVPLGVQGHHALMDGIHAGKYYGSLQTYLDRPGESLDRS
jgi:chloramphenicol O-acetyltransferase type A